MPLYEGLYRITVEADNPTHAGQKLYDCFVLCSNAIVDGEAPCVSTCGEAGAEDITEVEEDE